MRTKMLRVVLSVLWLVFSSVGVWAATYTGTAGDTKWTLVTDGSNAGTLTISPVTIHDNGECSTGNYHGKWYYPSDSGERLADADANDYKSSSPLSSRRTEVKSIVVEEGVTELGAALFYQFTNLTSVKLPESLTSIGYEAFRGCSKLSTIHLGPNVCTVRDRWASECPGMTSITLDENNKCLALGAEGALYELGEVDGEIKKVTLLKVPQARNIEEVTIPEGVSKIAADACYQMKSVKIVTIPSTVETIQYGCFDGCPKLVELRFKSEKVPVFVNNYKIGAKDYNGSNSTKPGNIKMYVPCIPDSTLGQREKDYASVTGIGIKNISGWLADFVIIAQVAERDADKGSAAVVTVRTCDSETSEIKATAHTGNGYHFAYWIQQSNGATIKNNPYSFAIAYSDTFYAYFAKDEYALSVVTSDPKLGKATGTGLYNVGTSVDIKATPLNDCASFVEWAEDGSTEAQRTITVTKDQTFTAVFKKNPFKASASVDPSEGGSVAIYDSTQVKNIGINDAIYCDDILSFTATPKEHYHFVNWNNEDLTDPVLRVVASGNESVTAYFEVDKYTVVFKNYDGTELQSSEEAYGATPSYTGTTPQKPATAEYTYTFSGWSPEVATVEGPAEYVAEFTATPKSYNFIKIVDGRETIKTVEFGASVEAPEDPSDKEGYTYMGWMDASSNGKTVEFPFNMPAKDTIVYANYVVNSYNFVVENFDRSVELSNDVYEYGSAVTMPAASLAPVRVGYTFTGWSDNVTTMPAHHDTIFALYEINNHKVVFRDSLDAAYSEAVNGDYGTTIVPVADPDHEGYTFVSWKDEENNVVDFSTFTMPDNDVTVIASYKINQYTITFNTDGGTEIAPIKQDYATAVVAPADPEKEGYTFQGWDKALPATMPAKDTTFTATWKINQYTITFDTKGGSAIAPIKQDYATAVEAPANPTKEGYTFQGWDQEIPAKMPAENKTITAIWKINQYTITFNTDGGTAITPIKQDYATAVEAPADPEKVGYTFQGWDKALPATMPAKDTTFTATWKINQYTITFDTKGGSAIAPIKQDYATAVEAPADPEKEGYTFQGWDQEIPAKMPAENKTITAQWTVNQYTITFNSNGGSAVAPITQDFGTTVTKPADPTKEGYTFGGWDQPVPSTMPSEDITLNAQWTINSYLVRFEDYDHSKISEANVEYNATITKPADPTRTGYVFAGWSPVVPEKMPAAKQTFVATYDLDQFTLTYKDYDGTVIGTPAEIDFETSVTTPANNPTRKGYTFRAWVDEANADVVYPFSMPAEDVTITADYTINQYTITFDTKGGTTIAPIEQDYETVVVAPANPTKEGYTFNGWDKEIPATMPDENMTITANWTVNQYTITFNTDGGNTIAPIKQDFGTAVTAPADPTKKGHSFLGWDEAIPATMPAKDTTFTAQWQINNYSVTFLDFDGNTISSESLPYSSAITFPADPVKVGFTFSGWSPTITAVPDYNVIIRATSTLNSHELTFVDYDGTTVFSAISGTVNYGTNVAKPEFTPTREGYTFKEWQIAGSDVVFPYSFPDEDVTMTAGYTINQYTITFDTKGGTTIAPITQDYATAVVAPAEPEKEGYTFAGWDQPVPSTMPADNMTISAQWTANPYNFITDVDGLTTTKVYKFSESVATPVAPANKEGHTFNGWKDSKDVIVVFPFDMPAKDTTVYVNWTVNNYTVRFEDYDGTEIVTNTVAYGDPIVAPADPTREGYEFKGWNKEVQSTMPAENLVYRATYAILSYNLTYVTDEDEVISTSAVPYHTSLTAPADDEKEGYTFLHWKNVEADTIVKYPFNMPAKNVKIQAVQQINEYTISFDSKGGSAVASITQNYNTAITAPANPTKTGYTFDGWTPALPEKMPAEDMELEAIWNINSYNFITNVDGVATSKSYDYDASVAVPATPEKEGYTFNAWVDAKDAAVEIPFNMPANDTTVYATWNINHYNFVVNVDGDKTTTVYDYNEAVATPATPEKEGYTFKEWSPEVPANMPAHGVEVVAQWTINKHQLTFKYSADSVISTATVEYGKSISAPADPKKEGYTFTGWDKTVPSTMPDADVTCTAVFEVNPYVLVYEDFNGTVLAKDTLDFGSSDYKTVADPERVGYTFQGWSPAVPATMPAKDVTVTATYKINKYTVNFYTHDGVLVKSVNDDYQKLVVAPTTSTHSVLVREGYTFTGWDKTVPSVVPAENVDLYATYDINSYTITFKDYDASVLKTQTVAFAADTIKVPADPERVGHKFTGWKEAVPATMPSHDVVCVAQYDILSYTLRFYDYDNTLIKGVKGTYGSKFTAPTPSHEGLIFKGWNPDEVPATIPAEDKSFYAVYDSALYNVKFYDYNSTVLSNNDVKFGTVIAIPTDPEREGYTFKGWTPDVPSLMPASALEFTAKYDVNAYSYVFCNEDGSIVKEQTSNFGTRITQPARSSMAREGYEFKGWSKTVPATIPAYNDTVYAVYEVKKFVITFNDYKNQMISSETLNYGDAVVAPDAPAREGYTFEMWADSLPETMPAENVTLTAKYKINSYVLSFRDYNYRSIQTGRVNYNSTIVAPTVSEREGYDFIGWDKVVPATMPAHNDTFIAQYKVQRYTITFAGQEEDTVYSSVVYDYDSPIVIPEDPTRKGYSFKGWDAEIPERVPNVNITFFATWEANTYSITYKDYNDTIIKVDEFLCDKKVLPISDPKREGHSFTGWEPEVPAVMPGEDIEVVAQYKKNQYVVVFTDEKGDTLLNDTLYYGDPIVAPADPEKDGYEFQGWEPAIPETVPAEDLNIKPIFTRATYVITFYDYDRTKIDSDTLLFEAKVKAPADPTREGYTFEGWSPKVPSVMPAENIDIVAQYSKNKYVVEFRDDDDNILVSDTLDFGDPIVPPADPEKDGYTFEGWEPAIPETVPAEDLTVKPIWSEDSVVIAEGSLKAISAKFCAGEEAGVSFKLESGLAKSFIITFDDDAVEAGFPATIEGEIADKDTVLYFDIPSTIAEGEYNASLVIVGDANKSASANFQISTNINSSYLSRMWNDVVVCDNSDNEFVAYQWKKNGEEIVGATKQFYCEIGGLEGKYSVVVTTKDGKEKEICGIECDRILPPFSISATPNPAKANEKFTLEVKGLTEDELAVAKIFVYNVNGTLALTERNIDEKNLVSLPSGEYVALVVVKGKSAFCKVIVR